MSQLSTYIQFEKGQQVAIMQSESAPDSSWYPVFADYQWGQPVKLKDGKLFPISAQEIRAYEETRQRKQLTQQLLLAVEQHLRFGLVSQTSDLERMGWNVKILMTLIFMNESMFPANLVAELRQSVQIECDLRGEGETPKELSEKWLYKFSALTKGICYADGMKHQLEKKIKDGLITTETEIAQILNLEVD